MQQLTFVSPGKVEWREVPEPRLQADTDAIIQPKAVTRCDLDFAIAHGLLGWEGPFALGHETAGVVVDVGDAVTNVKPGDRVVVPFQISCGECDPCRSGFTSNCTGVAFRSSYGMAPLSGIDYGGGLSDLLRVPFANHMLVPCPDAVPLSQVAGIADAASDGFNTVATHLAKQPGARVLIVGGQAQGVGLLAAHAAVALGASEVVYLDDNIERLSVADTLGATAITRTTYDGTAPGAPFPITVDADITPAGLALAVRSTAHGGVCHRTYGDLGPTTEAPLQDMYSIGVSLHIGRVNARAVMPEVLQHIERGTYTPDATITMECSFAEAAEGILDPTTKVLFLAD